uniref:Uncharacterized protein n=1 Tax=Ditylenchus dipsaci TaxID=166011 RepID=A0A915CZ39_9BILA
MEKESIMATTYHPPEFSCAVLLMFITAAVALGVTLTLVICLIIAARNKRRTEARLQCLSRNLARPRSICTPSSRFRPPRIFPSEAKLEESPPSYDEAVSSSYPVYAVMPAPGSPSFVEVDLSSCRSSPRNHDPVQRIDEPLRINVAGLASDRQTTNCSIKVPTLLPYPPTLLAEVSSLLPYPLTLLAGEPTLLAQVLTLLPNPTTLLARVSPSWLSTPTRSPSTPTPSTPMSYPYALFRYPNHSPGKPPHSPTDFPGIPTHTWYSLPAYSPGMAIYFPGSPTDFPTYLLF